MNPTTTDNDNKDAVDVTGPLPQPTDSNRERYRYLRFQHIKSEFFPKGPVDPDRLCWVLLSKGKGKAPQLYKRARVVSPCDNDAEERILVRYPQGSTYRVRKTHLMPVLEDIDVKKTPLILVCSETNDYRRMSIVHTRPEDHFLEIGCDFGILVDSVDAKTRLGVDKSDESIRIAKERYPERNFLLGDIFEEDLGIQLPNPSVIAIDINGNRMLPAVLRCIQLSQDKWSPRIIVVKSRELHAKMVAEET